MKLRIKEENGVFYIEKREFFIWSKYFFELPPYPTVYLRKDIIIYIKNGMLAKNDEYGISYNFSDLDECRRFIQQFILDKKHIDPESKITYHEVVEKI